MYRIKTLAIGSFCGYFERWSSLSSENQEVIFASFIVLAVSLKVLIPFYLVINIFVHDMSQMVSFEGVSFVTFSCDGKQTGTVLS